MNREQFKTFAAQLIDTAIYFDEPLRKYSFTKTGGNADVYMVPKQSQDVISIVKYCDEQQIPLTVLGNGSNILISERGIRGVVLSLLGLQNIHQQGHQIIADSGAAIIDVSEFACQKGLTGLEFACGIPGSIGGAIYMNAGAYGGEVKDICTAVTVVQRNGQIVTYHSDDLAFSYRHSKIQDEQSIVLQVTFDLKPGDITNIKAIMADLTEKRQSKQPLEYPSCGSVFKRPTGYFAGALIQQANLQGYRIGGVEVSTKHAGFMVNVDHGTCDDYIQLINHVQKVVQAQFGVLLEPEVRIIGEEGEVYDKIET